MACQHIVFQSQGCYLLGWPARAGVAGTAQVDEAQGRAKLAGFAAHAICAADAQLAVGVASPARHVATDKQGARVCPAGSHRHRFPPCQLWED